MAIDIKNSEIPIRTLDRNSQRGALYGLGNKRLLQRIATNTWEEVKSGYPVLEGIDLKLVHPDKRDAEIAYYLTPTQGEVDRKGIIVIVTDFTAALDYLRIEGNPVTERIAERLTLPLEELTDPELIRFFVAHEAGHAVLTAGQSYEQISERKKKEYAALPETRPNRTIQQKFAYSLAYRELPMEVEADDFAADFLRKKRSNHKLFSGDFKRKMSPAV